MAGDQLLDPPGKAASASSCPTFSPKPRRMPRRLISTSWSFDLHQLARGQQRAHLLRRQRLAMHRPEPAQPHQLRDAARILAIGLHRHRLEGIAHVPRLQQLDRKPGFPHRRIQPLRQRSSLQPDPRQAQAQRPEPADQRLRLAGNLGLANDLARSHPQRTRSSFPMTRRFLHNGPWSSLDDAWSRRKPDSVDLTPSV